MLAVRWKLKRWAGWCSLGIAGLLVGGIPAAAGGPAPADILTVCGSGCDFTTIPAAITAASPGDTISIAAGSYTGGLVIGKSLILQGAGAGQTAIVGGQPVIAILSGAEVSLDGVAIRNGDYANPVDGEIYTGGGGIQNAGTLTLANSTVSGNSATGTSQASDNDYDRSGYGGGIFNYCGTVTLINTMVSGNTAQGGDHTLTLAGGEATGGVGYGGGIFNLNGSVTLISSTVKFNDALGGDGFGGSGRAGRGGNGIGAGIYSLAWSGGGCPAGAAVDLIGSTVHDNHAAGGLGIGGGGPGGNGLGGNSGAGAIYSAGSAVASVSLLNSTISGNTTVGGNGCSGPEADPAGGNGSGGGISTNALTLRNSTVAYNRAAGGSALSADCSQHNPALDGLGLGGGLEHGGAIFYQRAQNTIVAHNTPTDCLFPITSEGHNLETGSSCGFNGVGDVHSAGAGLAPLQPRGGSTWVHPLYIGSPALDAGDNGGCPAGDQRGETRPQDGACDIGAFEGWVPYGLFLPTVTK